MESNLFCDLLGDESDEDDDLIAKAYDESVNNDDCSVPKQSTSSIQGVNNRGHNPEFDLQAGKTWIYPVNYPLREYQYAIVEKALFQNTLVSLPTGLGKTFIAAVVMYNYYRWFPRSKIIFMAPTKPLVAQQIEACFNIMGIPQSDMSQMTGSLPPSTRLQLWRDKRIFFLTPQVLFNDFARDACPAKLIKCLVLDEAHRALGNHAYCQVVRELRERRCEFRILALSATPGSDFRAVKEVITNLLISNVDMRHEDSPDIVAYAHHRRIEKVVVPLGVELTNLKIKFIDVSIILTMVKGVTAEVPCPFTLWMTQTE
ncbi:hypothetical protein SK128_010799 [Halocaridina rubra]|uniref:Helicase ATP-binding domain-containing protein n=1 Tax=Halocaridina rubra TaxID=373956 RepID=A0AAN8WB29_HALRR